MPSFKETRVRGVADLHKGDQIAIDRGDIKHHMIVTEDPTYLDEVSVIHYYNDTWPGGTGACACSGKAGVPLATVRKDKIDISSDVRKGRVYRIDYSTYTSPDVTVQRARSKLGERKFSPLTNNCEHFATWCKTGIYESSQSEAFLAKSVFEVAKQDLVLIELITKDAPKTAMTKSLATGAKQVAKEGANTAVKNTAKSAVKEGAKSVAKNGAKQGMWQGTSAFRYPVGQGTCKYGVRNTAKSAVKESAKGTMKEGTKAAAKSGGKSFGKKIMEKQGKIGIALTVAEESYYFARGTLKSLEKCDKGEISLEKCVGEVATHAVKGVATGTATVVGGTAGQTVGSAVGLFVGTPFGPFAPVFGLVGGVVGGTAGAMAGKAAVMLGGWLLGS